MKYLFDFDDVLFNNTKQFKPHMYATLEAAGVPEKTAFEYYQTVREREFSLRNFILELLQKTGKDVNQTEEIYKTIMKEAKNFTNTLLLEKVKQLGKDNCFIVTNGDDKFNQDKIDYSGVGHLFSEIYIVPGSKKEIIYGICERFKDEKVIFTDDKIKFFEDLDLSKCPNLQNVLYTM